MTKTKSQGFNVNGLKATDILQLASSQNNNSDEAAYARQHAAYLKWHELQRSSSSFSLMYRLTAKIKCLYSDSQGALLSMFWESREQNGSFGLLYDTLTHTMLRFSASDSGYVLWNGSSEQGAICLRNKITGEVFCVFNPVYRLRGLGNVRGIKDVGNYNTITFSGFTHGTKCVDVSLETRLLRYAFHYGLEVLNYMGKARSGRLKLDK